MENYEGISTRSLPVVVIECVDAYVDVGGVTSYKGTHCWVVSGGESGRVPSDIKGPISPIFKPNGFPQSEKPGGSFNDGSKRWYFSFSKFVSIPIYNSTKSKLNLLDREALQSVIAIIPRSPEGYRDLYNYIVNKKMTFTFKVDNSISSPAQIDPEKNEITFRHNSDITLEYLMEELFHAVQYHFLYKGKMNNMYKNYEFEAQVFRDFSFILCLNDPSCDMGMGGYAGINYSNVDPAFRKKYIEWMRMVEQSGWVSPYLLSEFEDMCKEWKGIDREFLPGFTPRGIYQFLSKKPPKPPKPSN